MHVSRAEIIDELETTLPRSITNRHQTPFIHVLRIVPPRNASLESLWTQLDAAESSIAASKEELELELIRSEREIMEAMDVRVAFINKLPNAVIPARFPRFCLCQIESSQSALSDQD